MTKKSFLRYYKFAGRAPRAEMWKAWLIAGLVPIIPIIILMALFVIIFQSEPTETQLSLLMLIAGLPFYPIFIATLVRRLHDLNWSGWWPMLFILEIFVFEIGERIYEHTGEMLWWMWVFVPPLACCHLLLLYGMFALFIGIGTTGLNKYGADPLE